jgi:tRNA threonylcarbamoyladenosine biosynthesis protein TsaB
MPVSPCILLLETSGRSGQVGLAEGNRLLAARTLDEARRHARDLAPAVVALLDQQGWRPSDVRGVIVDRGPGSYTGLRVGLMSAKAFAYAIGCPVVAVTSFAAIAHQYDGESARLDVIADAQQGMIYVQSFQRAADAVFAPMNDMTIGALTDWLTTLRPGAAVSGPGLRLYGQRMPAGVEIANPDQWEPRVASLLTLGLDRLVSERTDDVWSLEPLYLRPSSAEEKWKAQGRG